jgi:sugar O-acyltransferase (sialic acid O-acetyltransferase NeuD family)
MSDVVIFGTGDYGRIAERYLTADSPHDVVAFTVDREYADAGELSDRPVVPFDELTDRFPPGSVEMLVAVGFSGVNQERARVYDECKRLGYSLITYVNSHAFFWEDVPIGDNSFVFEANVVQPSVTIGSNVVLWSGNHIGHDVTIGDHCFVASHVVISGHASIGEGCFLGVNATVRDGVRIAPRCVIGSGALIMKDTEEGGVYSVRRTEPRDMKSWDLEGF